jgi:hypothetical protein
VVVSIFFYWLAGRDMRREARRLHQLSNLITRGLEDGKIAKFNRDEQGNPIGMTFELQPSNGLG